MSTICKNTGRRQELPCINCTCESSDSTAELGDVRYVLHPGYVTSANDRQTHFIGGPRLASLYGLNIGDRNRVVFGDAPTYREQPGDVHLRPRRDGNYTLPNTEAMRHAREEKS